MIWGVGSYFMDGKPVNIQSNDSCQAPVLYLKYGLAG